MKELIIDRFEEGYVVCETPTGGFDAIPRKNLPPNAEEASSPMTMYPKAAPPPYMLAAVSKPE